MILGAMIALILMNMIKVFFKYNCQNVNGIFYTEGQGLDE